MPVAKKPALGDILESLQRHHGKPAPPISRDPFHLILWEQVAYLVPDSKRLEAFEVLRQDVGIQPEEILAATPEVLTRIAHLGGSIAAASRAARMRQSAEMVLGNWRGDLRKVLKLPLPAARKALAAFPMIGEPGADKILLYCHAAPLLSLDSNALRVIQRLGLAPTAKDYRSAYRAAQQSLADQLPTSCEELILGAQLLRHHGQELCRRSAPRCGSCPVQGGCPSGRRSGVTAL